MKTLRLPEDLDGAQLVKWDKTDGDAIVAGEALATFELDGVEKHLVAEDAGVLARIMVRPDDDVTFGGGAAVAILAQPGEDIGYHALRAVRVMVRRTCGACGNDYPLNGLVRSMVCPSCRVDEKASAEFWKSYVFEGVTEALEKSSTAGSTVLGGQFGAATLQCSSQLPLCRSCVQLFAWSAFAPVWEAALAGTPGEVACTGCDAVASVRAAPDWARTALPGLLGAVGELGGEAKPPITKPVMFTCPQCSAPLKVDGARRIVTCAHCDVDVRLPDDLWSHFNPVPKWERWWLVFGPPVPGATWRSKDDEMEAQLAEAFGETEPSIDRAEPPEAAGLSPVSKVVVALLVLVCSYRLWQVLR